MYQSLFIFIQNRTNLGYIIYIYIFQISQLPKYIVFISLDISNITQTHPLPLRKDTTVANVSFFFFFFLREIYDFSFDLNRRYLSSLGFSVYLTPPSPQLAHATTQQNRACESKSNNQKKKKQLHQTFNFQ